MATTQEQIDRFISITRLMGAIDGVRSAIVNDWGKFGNFDIHIQPRMRKNHNDHYELQEGVDLRKIINACKKIVKEHNGIHWRQHFVPDRKTKWCTVYKRSEFSGYHRDYVSIDIDHMAYNTETNSFGE